MLIMITTLCPPHKAVELAKLYLKQPRQIPYVTKWRIFNTVAGKDGMKAYHLLYTEKGKGEEVIMGINKYFFPFTQIEGFTMQAEVLMGVSDSYKAAGMKWE